MYAKPGNSEENSSGKVNTGGNLPEKSNTFGAREDKGDREGIPHTHPIP